MNLRNWLRRRKEKKTEAAQVKKNAYLERLENSSRGFCGCRHSGSGPFLSVGEIHELITKERESVSVIHKPTERWTVERDD